jgi:hypothetical protein
MGGKVAGVSLGETTPLASAPVEAHDDETSKRSAKRKNRNRN